VVDPRLDRLFPAKRAAKGGGERVLLDLHGLLKEGEGEKGAPITSWKGIERRGECKVACLPGGKREEPAPCG